MKKYTVTTNELIGKAFVAGDEAQHEHDKEPVVALHRSDMRREAIEATDTVRMVGDVDVVYGDDYTKMQAAVDAAEAGEWRTAEALLNSCRQTHTRAWARAQSQVAAISDMCTGVYISLDDVELVRSRAQLLELLFKNHPGGAGALQAQKQVGTPGPGTLLAFHRHIYMNRYMPYADFGVRGLSIENMPRGADSHHAGWLYHFDNNHALFLDCAWGVTLDVIQLCDASEQMRESARERLAEVPSSLRAWREYQIMAAEGVDEFSAMEKARAELGS